MAAVSRERKLVTLWSAALETWCHQILYLRHVYPPSQETFAPTRFLGIATCQACRHPGVVRYITNTLNVIVPSILSGSISEISLVVMKDSFTVSETFTLTLDDMVSDATMNDIDDSLEQAERAMRDLILSTLSLEGLPRKSLTDDASFKIVAKTAADIDTQQCPELNKAFQEGTWYQPKICNSTDKEDKTKGTVRPLCNISLPGGGVMQMNLVFPD